MISTGVPRGNGQVERLNAVVINSLARMSISDDLLMWYKHNAKLQQVLNSTVNRSTKKTPFELLFGVSMSCVEDINLAKILEDELNIIEWSVHVFNFFLIQCQIILFVKI